MSQCRAGYSRKVRGRYIEKNPSNAAIFSLTRLDLVSREEFDVQTQVLLRTRENWRRWSNASAN